MNPTWEDPIVEEEDDSLDSSVVYGRDAMIYLIDATQEMFSSGSSEIPFHLCLKCARTSLTNKIVTNSKDLQAVVFFGTEKGKNLKDNADFPHIYVLQDLGEPGAERVLEIEALITTNAVAFAENLGHSKDFSLADAFWLCSQIFANSSYTLGHKRVLLFTATDSPHEGNTQLQIQAKTKGKDMFDNGIDIELMHIQKPDTIFDVSRFYKSIIRTSDEDDCKLPDPSEKFDELLTRVRAKDHKKRTVSSVMFRLGNGLEIGLSIYKLVVQTPKPAPTKLCKENNAELTSFTKTFLTDTGEVLLNSDLKKFQEYGTKKVYAEVDEVKRMRNIEEPCLILIGFKPLALLRKNYHVHASVFAYPDEKAAAGSTRLFHALLLQCQKREYMPVCRFVLRKNDSSRFVLLLPQEEEVDTKGTQLVPQGFHIVYLPFMEDLRGINHEPKHNPSVDLVDKAKDIIKKLQFAYNPESFENPVLQKHWRNIEALALNREAPEEITDYTLPTKDIIEKRAGKLIEEFKTLLCPQNDDANKSQMGGGYGPSAKRPKFDEASVPVNLLAEATSGQLGRYKVNILKEFCKRNGIRSGTKKADIIEAIRMYYGQT